MPAHPYKGFRIPQDLLDQVLLSAQSQNIEFSDWVRQAIVMRLYSESSGDPGLAYAAARSLVIPMVKQILGRMTDVVAAELPDTYEEAMLRYGFVVGDPSAHGG